MKLKPNYKLSLIVMLLFFTNSVSAQQVIPLPTDRGDNLSVFLDDIQFSFITETNSYGLQFRFVVMGGKLPRQERILIRPQLANGDNIAAFPPVEIDGQWVYYQQVRSGTEPTGLHYLAKDVNTHQQYGGMVAAANWMQMATLSFNVERVNACGDVLCSSPYFYRAPTPEYLTTRDKDVRHEKTMRLQGRSYVSFLSGSDEVLTDYRNNRKELSRLCHTIDSVSNNPDINIMSIRVTGYASPEGSFVKNDQLASRRTNSLTRYITVATTVSPSLFQTAHVAEDWEGLRTFVDTTAMLANRTALLQIIDSDRDPDDKLTFIQKKYPKDYAVMLNVAFPLLRHTDYQIDYVQKNVTHTLGKVHTDTIYRLHADTLSTGWQSAVTPEPYRTFRPLLAVKTNLLYDLVLAPNIEVEVPFGRDRRWSVMAEYTNPWWRWKNLDYSYQIQEGGVELRRWLLPRCNGSRPWLSGLFAGVYGAIAKYDIENDGTGDQGEVWSAGATLGYSCPLNRRLNMEFSLSAGYVKGERRHYNAEFDSTHLIYKYTKNLGYFGPTKLKVSLVWIIPSKKK